MPNIRTYEAPKGLGLQPDERGTDAALQVARRGGAFFNQAADAVESVGKMEGRMAESTIRDVGKAVNDYMEHREVSQGAASYAGLNDKLTQQWNETAKGADPNDPTVAQKFREQILEPELQKFGQSFLTEGAQKWAQTRVESLRSHMFEKTSADMGTLAAAAVSTNVRQMSNSMSNTAMTDPSSVPHLLEGIDSSIAGMVDSSPYLKGATGAKARLELSEKMREGIVKAGAIGAIQKAADPEGEAERWGAKYPNYINGAELKQLGQEATRQRRADHTAAQWDKQLQTEAKKQQSDATEKGYLQKLYSDDPKVQATVNPKAIVNDPSLTREASERMVNIVNREFKPETDAKISAATSVQLFRRIADPNADPQEVRRAIIDARAKDPGAPGSLSKSDFTDAMKNLEDIKTPAGAALAQDRTEFFKRYAPTIDPSMGNIESPQFGHHTALGLQKMYGAEKDARRLEADLKAKGQDPHSLYDPASPNFFGRPANLMKYRASMQEATGYQARLNEKSPGTNPPAAPQPGDITQGYKFKGGDPSKPDSWEKVK